MIYSFHRFCPGHDNIVVFRCLLIPVCLPISFSFQYQGCDKINLGGDDLPDHRGLPTAFYLVVDFDDVPWLPAFPGLPIEGVRALLRLAESIHQADAKVKGFSMCTASPGGGKTKQENQTLLSPPYERHRLQPPSAPSSFCSAVLLPGSTIQEHAARPQDCGALSRWWTRAGTTNTRAGCVGVSPEHARRNPLRRFLGSKPGLRNNMKTPSLPPRSEPLKPDPAPRPS